MSGSTDFRRGDVRPDALGPRPTVLYAEDEGLIAALVEDCLVDAGFDVLVADSGATAARLLEQKGDQVAALVTDIQLGAGMDGWELARAARAINEQLPVVYTTGDSAHLWSSEGVPLSVVIQKPFVEAQVITALANLLNES
jgi:CheY-like chemotaxis protein